MAASARAHHRGYRRSVVTGGVNRCERQASISEHHRRADEHVLGRHHSLAPYCVMAVILPPTQLVVELRLSVGDPG
jgi:hypothetical protein